jgi:hypothetical protein
MGREIVYCEGCGNSLREDDFERGKARTIDNRPFCIECRPLKAGDAEPPRRKKSSSQIPAAPPRKTSTGAIPIVAAPARRPAPATKQSNPLPVIAGVVGVVFIVLIFAITGGSTRRPAPPEPAPPPLVEIPVRRPATPPPPETPPPPTRELPPPPTPRREPPPSTARSSDPLVAPSASEKLDAFLGQIKQMIQGDTAFERIDEILNMFSAAAKNAGARSAEVEKMKTEYLSGLDEPVRRALAWRDWRITNNAAETGPVVSYAGRGNVLMTHPIDRQTPARLERDVDIPAGKKTTLSFWVSCHEKGDFELRVFVDGKQLLKELIGPPGSGWKQKSVDLTSFAGKRIAIRLENFPNNWEWEHAYWSDLAILSE